MCSTNNNGGKGNFLQSYSLGPQKIYFWFHLDNELVQATELYYRNLFLPILEEIFWKLRPLDYSLHNSIVLLDHTYYIEFVFFKFTSSYLFKLLHITKNTIVIQYNNY